MKEKIQRIIKPNLTVSMALKFFLVASFLTGCLDKPLAVGNPCVLNGVVQKVRVDNIEKVDLLFMVDNSDSMSDEQQFLVNEIDRMVSVLTTGRLNPDVPCGGDDNPCVTDFNPVKDLNVAVVTSDMGTGELMPTSMNPRTLCGQVPRLGDDGVFQRSSQLILDDPATFNQLKAFAAYRSGSRILPQDFEAQASDALQDVVGEIGNLLETNMLTAENRDANVGVILQSIEGSNGADKFSLSNVGEIVDFALDQSLCEIVDENTPNFLSFVSEDAGAQDAEAFNDQFRCAARRGVSGCAFEQPMESLLKALTTSQSNRTFRSRYNPNQSNADGRGDGLNDGFIREDALLAIVVVTDEDDCSIEDPFVSVRGAGAPVSILDIASPVDKPVTVPNIIATERSPNFRCVDYPNTLRSVEALSQGLIELKADPSLLVFGLIAGVPIESVQTVNQSCSTDEECYVDANGDGSFSDDEKFGFCDRFEGQNEGRCAHQFNTILAHPNMTPHEGFLGDNPTNVVGSDEDASIEEATEARIDAELIQRAQIMPSCLRGNGINEQTGNLEYAIPPTRLVEITKNVTSLGGSGLVKSICDDDFRPALDAILGKIADVLAGTCLPRPLNQNAQGQVNCEVVEILPAVGDGDRTQCAQVASRGRSAEPIRTIVEDGKTREVCLINQLSPPQDPQNPNFGGERGWYYDNRSEKVQEACGRFTTQQRIAFSIGASAEVGSTIRLECTQPVVGGSEEIILVGSSCIADADCEGLSKIEGDTKAICDPRSLTCQYSCEVDSECKSAGLSGYRCDTRDAASSFCVNPICVE